MSQKTLGEVFKEAYTIGLLSEEEQAKYYLIERYENKVSDRLLKEKEALKLKGNDAFAQTIKMSMENPFLSHIKDNGRTSGWLGQIKF